MRAFVAMAHYDPDGQVAPHVRRHILALQAFAERVVVVSTADLLAEDEVWLRDNVELIRRDNYGYDFLSYKTGLDAEPNLHEYDHVIVCNDSYVGPFVAYADIVAEMDSRPVDFWGLTRSDRVAPHVQSFFVCFRPWVVRSKAFRSFWERMTPLSDRRQVILRYEVGMTGLLESAGFASGSYFEETSDDVLIARRRVRWWAALRVHGLRGSDRRRVFRQRAAEAWNPCIALADRCLGDSRLPIAKIDTLRYDPYGLDSARLLRTCLAHRPDHFGDVPGYLERTCAAYPVRENERLPKPPISIRAFHRWVRYA